MREKIKKLEEKYEVQFELLDGGFLEGLDERTLHETIKAMLVNTIKDCVKYETWMDPEMAKIAQFITKKEKTEDETKQIKNAQERLRKNLHCAQISEIALKDLLFNMLLNDYIKIAFKQDIPALYENIYYLVDIEEEISDELMYIFSELYEAPNYKYICNVINDTIEKFVLNAEEYVEEVKDADLYDEFVEQRKKLIERQPKEETDE